MKKKNFINTKRGELQVLSFNNGQYDCLCSCGKHCDKTHLQLVWNPHPDCGCRNKDLSNCTFGSLKVLSFDGITKHPMTKNEIKNWKCLCECGNICIFNQQKLISGSTQKTLHCGCKENKISKRFIYNKIISSYKYKAKEDKIDFKLTEFEYFSLFNSNCYYCNILPSNSTDGIKYSGIDRLDSNLGYTTDNVVSCCFPCNFMKNRLSHNEFLSHISRILQNSYCSYLISL